MSCSAVLNTSLSSSRFEQLLRNIGKPLPANIYQLISYVEFNILDDQAKQPATKRKPQAERAKVLRETRLIPKVILAIENFNKHIILLSKKDKTNDRLANYLHFGAVRDFNIKSGDLMAVIERTYSHSSQIEVSDSNLENVEDEDEDEGEQQVESVANDDGAESVSYDYDNDNNDDCEKVDEDEGEEEEEQEQQQAKKKVKKQASKQPKKQQETTGKAERRRRVLSSDGTEEEATPPKRRRGRTSKK